MAHLTGIEGAIDAVITYLTAHQVSKMAALNTAYGGVPILDPWTGVFDVEQVQPASGTQYPYVEVLAGRTVVLAESAPSFTFTHDIMCIINVADDDSRATLRRRAERYALALLELIKDGQLPPAAAEFSGYTSTKKGPIDFLPLHWDRGKSRIIAEVVVGLQFTTMEVYP